MKGIGNYRFREQVERRPGVVVSYRGNRAIVRFHNGQTYGLPAARLKELEVPEGGYFMMVITTVGRAVRDIRIEASAPPNPMVAQRALAKVYQRDGKRVVTRK